MLPQSAKYFDFDGATKTMMTLRAIEEDESYVIAYLGSGCTGVQHVIFEVHNSKTSTRNSFEGFNYYYDIIRNENEIVTMQAYTPAMSFRLAYSAGVTISDELIFSEETSQIDNLYGANGDCIENPNPKARFVRIMQ